MTDELMTTAEMAARLKCSVWLVLQMAKRHEIGLRLPGKAGWRFDETDVARLKQALAPAPPVERRRRRRSA